MMSYLTRSKKARNNTLMIMCARWCPLRGGRVLGACHRSLMSHLVHTTEGGGGHRFEVLQSTRVRWHDLKSGLF